MKSLLLFLICLFARGSAHAGWFGPNNYEDCILENIKGVTQTQAIGTIKNACRSKFPQDCYAWKKSMSRYKLGQVYEGYRFIGENPAVRKNWVPLSIMGEQTLDYARRLWQVQNSPIDESPAARNQPPEGCRFN